MKRYITLVLALVLMGGYGCNREVVSGLDDSVMLKTQQLLDSYNKALIDAPNGWIIQIKTNEGFYRFWMEFKEGGIVNMLTDNIRLASSSTTVQESFYSIQQKQRATIVFETYSYLSVLNDPDNGISGGSGHVGLETDFEFEVDSFVNGVFELTGRINRVQARMIQATQDQKDGILLGGMVQEIQDLGRVSGGINNHRYIEVDGKKIGLLIKPRTTLAFYTKASGSEYVQSYPMVEVASRDLKLDNPMNVDGLIIDGFRWDQQGQKYYALSGGTEYEVKSSTTPPIQLYEIFGHGKPFNKLRLNSSTVSGYGYSGLTFLLLTLLAGPVSSVDYTFEIDDDGMEFMHVSINISTGGSTIPIVYSFQVTWDANDKTQFKLSDTVYYDYDASKIAKGFYELPALSPTSGYVNTIKGKTFKLEWGSVTPPADYAAETIIQLTGVSGSSTRAGILMK